MSKKKEIREKKAYSYEDKRAIADHYVMWGNQYKLSKDLGIPEQTVSMMINESLWFPRIYEEAKLAKQEELDARFTKAIHETLDALDDRIMYGDYKLHARTKELVRVPVAAKDLSSVANTVFDKRQLLRGDATTIASRKLEDTKALEEKFLKIAQDLQMKDVVVTYAQEDGTDQEGSAEEGEALEDLFLQDSSGTIQKDE
jgi:hypothetical protein